MKPTEFKSLVKQIIKESRILENDEGLSYELTFKRELFAPLEKIGFRHLGNQPQDYMEYYEYNFATIQIGVDLIKKKVRIERYYDNERLDDMYRMTKEVDIPQQDLAPEFIKQFTALADKMKKGIRGDQSIYGDMEVEESYEEDIEGPTDMPKGASNDISASELDPSKKIKFNFKNKTKCKNCGKEFTPSFGEHHRCPSCMGKSLSQAEKATGVQENSLGGTGQSPIEGQSNTVAASRVNKILAEISKGIFSDNSWEAVSNIFKKLKESGVEATLLDAKYGGHADSNSGMPTYKEWKISIPFTNNKGKSVALVGQITAHGAGSIEQPLDKYDITAYVSPVMVKS